MYYLKPVQYLNLLQFKLLFLFKSNIFFYNMLQQKHILEGDISLICTQNTSFLKSFEARKKEKMQVLYTQIFKVLVWTFQRLVLYLPVVQALVCLPIFQLWLANLHLKNNNIKISLYQMCRIFMKIYKHNELKFENYVKENLILQRHFIQKFEKYIY